MKLISLNTWGGRYFEDLIDFISKHSKDTDIFCFQEIYTTTSNVKQYKNLLRANLLAEIKNSLPNFKNFHFPTVSGSDPIPEQVDFNLVYGPAIFVKKTINITSYKRFFISGDKVETKVKKNFSNIPTPLQHIQVEKDDKTFSIFNFHGTPFPPAKKDTPKRLLQSKKAKEIIDKTEGAKILVGDFNISVNTKSVSMFEENMKNLIKEFKIERTRSRLSPFFDKWNFQKFADYTFVSPDIKVKKFQVPDVEISDHLPMILKFE